MKNMREKKQHNVIKLIFLTILLIILIYASKFLIGLSINGWSINGVVRTVLGTSKHSDKKLEPLQLLLLGTNENNTDTILVAAYNPKTQEASLLSIPRDTFIGKDKMIASGSSKLNSVYRIHGINAMMQKVSTITGLNIKNYLTVDTEGITKIVDAIGGVEFDVPIDMNYHDPSQNLSIELKKGKQKLNGIQAQGLIRFRHNDDGSTYPWKYGIEDHGRTRTQRNFIKELIKQALKFKNVSNVFKILNITQKYVKTNLDFNEVKEYIPDAMNFNPEKIKSKRLEGHDENPSGGAWYFFYDQEKLKKTINDLFVFSDNNLKNMKNRSGNIKEEKEGKEENNKKEDKKEE